MNTQETSADIGEAKAKQPVKRPGPRSRKCKSSKSDDKSVENALKSVSNLETANLKFDALYEKYTELHNENKTLHSTIKAWDRKFNMLSKDKEQLQAEHNRTILMRSRLESVCRELQRQNRAIKDESITAMREGEEKKKEVTAVFHSTLNELGNLVSKNNDKNNKLRDDNLEMSTKLKNVCEQYEKKEQHVEKLAKQLELEMQLTDAKLKKAEMEMAIERDTITREKQQLLLEVTQYKAAIEEHRETELELRKQIQTYNEKYNGFHITLVKSNEAIGEFKKEMECMSKQITRLEKETMNWKSKYESTHTSLLQMTEEKFKSDQNACSALKGLAALQGLCRTWQDQCNHLKNQLQNGGKSDGEPVKGKELPAPKSTEIKPAQIERQLKIGEGARSDSAPCPTKLLMDQVQLQNGEVKDNTKKNKNLPKAKERVSKQTLPVKAEEVNDLPKPEEPLLNRIHPPNEEPTIAVKGNLLLNAEGPEVKENPLLNAVGPEVKENPLLNAEGPEAKENPLLNAEGPDSKENPLLNAEGPEAKENPLPNAESPEAKENPLLNAEGPEAKENPLLNAEGPEAKENPLLNAEGPEAKENPLLNAEGPEAKENPLLNAEKPEAKGTPLPNAEGPEAKETPLLNAEGPEAKENPLLNAEGPETKENVSVLAEEPAVKENAAIVNKVEQNASCIEINNASSGKEEHDSLVTNAIIKDEIKKSSSDIDGEKLEPRIPTTSAEGEGCGISLSLNNGENKDKQSELNIQKDLKNPPQQQSTNEQKNKKKKRKKKN